MGPDANVRKLTVASVVAAADAVLKERSTSHQRSVPARYERATSEVTLEAILAEYKFALPEGYQDEIKAHLAAELEAGATLYGRRQDGAYIARTKSGDRVIPQSVEDS